MKSTDIVNETKEKEEELFLEKKGEKTELSEHEILILLHYGIQLAIDIVAILSEKTEKT